MRRNDDTRPGVVVDAAAAAHLAPILGVAVQVVVAAQPARQVIQRPVEPAAELPLVVVAPGTAHTQRLSEASHKNGILPEYRECRVPMLGICRGMVDRILMGRA
ncbi:MAG: hypothetical protein EXR60_04520 [Dehalococcoidia bacterium]|nr:hypothetical protein [Dehalococcoidia bacterium]